MHGDIGTGWGIAMFVVMVLFMAAIIVLAAWAIRTTNQPQSGTLATPIDTLERRLAAGEISIEEYDRLREKLSARE